MTAVQTEYNATIEPGLPGLVVGSDWNADTGIVETAAGLAFGIVVCQGTVSDKGIKIGGALSTYRGVTIRDITLVHAAALLDKYAQYENAGVLTRGKIWVLTGGAVAPGDPVHFVAATGVLKASGDIGPIVGARWVTTAASGELAVVELPGLSG